MSLQLQCSTGVRKIFPFHALENNYLVQIYYIPNCASLAQDVKISAVFDVLA